MHSEWFTCLGRKSMGAVLTCGVLAVACGAFPADGAELTVAEKEAEEAKAEDAAEQAAGEGAMLASEKTVSGKLVLGQMAEGRADIVGMLRPENSPAILLKLSAPGLLEALKPYHNKSVALQGKLRNQGKYFVVSNVVTPPATTVEFQKEGGL